MIQKLFLFCKFLQVVSEQASIDAIDHCLLYLSYRPVPAKDCQMEASLNPSVPLNHLQQTEVKRNCRYGSVT